jgi:hypothetical protein
MKRRKFVLAAVALVRGGMWRYSAGANVRGRAAGSLPRPPGQHFDPRGSNLVRDHAGEVRFNNLALYDQHMPQNSLQ